MIGKPSRGMVVEVGLDPVIGHEQGRSRPCVVVQNDIGNRYASTTVIVPLTHAANIAAPSPIYVLIPKGDGGTTKDSYALTTTNHAVFRKSKHFKYPVPEKYY